MDDLLPISVRPLASGSTQGRLQRLSAAEARAFMEGIAAWMPQQSVLCRLGDQPTALQLPASTVFGALPGGGLGAYSGDALDELLGLSAGLAARAPLLHTHDFRTQVTGIDWSTLQDNRVLARVSGQFVWLSIPTGGGGGGVSNPITSDLGIGNFAIVSGARTLLQLVGGQLQLDGRPLLLTSLTSPADGQALVYDGGEWVNGSLPGASVVIDLGGGLFEDADTVISDFAASIANKSNLDHTHGIEDIQGGTPGAWVRFDAGGVLEEVAAPTGSGGISNPLTGDLDIATHALVSGARELISVVGGNVRLDGRDVFPAEISSPAEGQVAVYDEGGAVFGNRLLTPADISGVTEGYTVVGNAQGRLEEVAPPSSLSLDGGTP